MLNKLTLVNDIEGFLSDKEADYLYKQAASIGKHGTILEIGSYCGKSTICIALSLKHNNSNSMIYAIDTFGGSSEHGDIGTFDIFNANLKKFKVQDYVTPIKTSSEEAFKLWNITKTIDFLWIDGGHEYEFVSNDINMWLRMVAIGGIIAIHDTGGIFQYGNCMGIRRALREHFFPRECLKKYGFIDSITFAQKTHTLTPQDNFDNKKAFLFWWFGEPFLYENDSFTSKIKLFFSLFNK